MIACEIKGRSCRGLELDARYVDVIVERWQKLTERDAILEETGETYANTSRY